MESEQAVVKFPVPNFKYSKRVVLKTILGREDGGEGLIGEKIVIGGWVKSSREMRKAPLPLPPPSNVASNTVVGPTDVSCVDVFIRAIMNKVLRGRNDGRFREKMDSVIPKQPPPPSIAILQVSDGSTIANLQVLVDSSLTPPSQLMPTGTCILAEGILQQPKFQGKHVIELKAEKIHHVGIVDQDKYPLSKKLLPLEVLRDCSQFGPRTTTLASVTRIRNALTQASHTFFQKNGFLYVQLPIITSTDFEGFNEKFHVTTLLGKDNMRELSAKSEAEGISLESVKVSIKKKSKQVEELKRSESNKEALAAAVQDLKKTNALALQLEKSEKTKSGALQKANVVNFSEDFFSRPTYLACSGRFHLESYSCALGNVYSFGPRFRAEKSESKFFLAEMWMIELEMAFAQLEDTINCADDFLKFLCQWILENCSEDLIFISKRVDKTVADHLQLLLLSSFEKISYAEAVDILKKVTEKTFESKIEWGVPLTEEHESYLTDQIYKKPVIIYNYPKELKPFYVRLNEDGTTVASFDMVVPKAGALIRGSQNEERLDKLIARITELGLPKEQYEWYLDLRRHGTVKHSGFSLVFDLLVLYATGLNDLRDVIPFPRSSGKANN